MVLPIGMSTATFFFPVLGGAVAASAVAWQVDKALAGIKQMRDDIDRLTTSDYKTTMQLFKEILICLANDVYPELVVVREVYSNAMDGVSKLDEARIEA